MYVWFILISSFIVFVTLVTSFYNSFLYSLLTIQIFQFTFSRLHIMLPFNGKAIPIVC